MNEKRRLLKNTGIIAIGNMGAKITSFLLLPLYTAILSTSDYGTYDFIVAMSSFLLPIVTVCMHEAMFRYIIEHGSNKNEYKSIIFNSILAVISGLVVLIIVVITLSIFFKSELFYKFLFYLVTDILYVFFVNLLRADGRMTEYAIISSAKNIMIVLINVFSIIVLRIGIDGLILSSCISEVIAVFVICLRSNIWKYFNFHFFSVDLFKEMLKYSIPLIPNSICAQIINISDRLIISATLGTESNGIYSISYKFPNIIETVYHYFYTAWSESASRSIETDKEKSKQYYQNMYIDVNNICFSLILVMIACMPILFRVFVRGDYLSGFYYVPMLMISMYFDCLAKFYSGIYTAYKETKVMAISTMIAAFINIVVNIALILKIQLYAAALSTLVAEIVLVVVRKRRIKKYIKLKLSIITMIKEIVAMLIILLLYQYNNWTMISISIIFATIFFVYTNSKIFFILYKKFISKRLSN